MQLTLEIKEPDIREIIGLLETLDDLTEELRIRQQEIYSYEEKENTLRIQLAQADRKSVV